MALILEVISYKNQPPQSPLSARFDEAGGTVGRAVENLFSLPDEEKFVSRHHANISWQNGVFLYQDVSTSGTLLSGENRLLQYESVPLADGDRLRIGEYDVLVRIEAVSPPPGHGFSAVLDGLPECSRTVLQIPLEDDLSPFTVPGESTLNPRSGFAPADQSIPSFIGQSDVPVLHENFVPPGSQPMPEEFSLNDFWAEEGEFPAAAQAAHEAFEFPDDLFSGLQNPQAQTVADNQVAGVAEGEGRDIPAEPDLPTADSAGSAFPPDLAEAVPDQTGDFAPPVETPTPEFSPAFAGVLFPSEDGQDRQLSSEDLLPTSLAGNDNASFPLPLEQDMGSREPGSKEPVAGMNIPRPGGSQPLPPRGREAAETAPLDAATVQTPQANLLQCFAQGAGLTGLPALTSKQQEEMMVSAGAVFREMVDGMMQVLRARSEEKREISLRAADVTLLKREKNNPLKFIPTVDDAIMILLFQNNPAYIGAGLAVREGFEDVMRHQMAMRAGMQASMAKILASLDPKSFEQKFEDGIVFQKKAKCWDAFSKAYPGLMEEAMEDLFGEAFASAYEEQMRVLGQKTK